MAQTQPGRPPAYLTWTPAREAFEERAAILEFSAGLPRAEAERKAQDMLWDRIGARQCDGPS